MYAECVLEVYELQLCIGRHVLGMPFAHTPFGHIRLSINIYYVGMHIVTSLNACSTLIQRPHQIEFLVFLAYLFHNLLCKRRIRWRLQQRNMLVWANTNICASQVSLLRSLSLCRYRSLAPFVVSIWHMCLKRMCYSNTWLLMHSFDVVVNVIYFGKINKIQWWVWCAIRSFVEWRTSLQQFVSAISTTYIVHRSHTRSYNSTYIGDVHFFFVVRVRAFPLNRTRCDIEFVTKAHGQRLWRFL